MIDLESKSVLCMIKNTYHMLRTRSKQKFLHTVALCEAAFTLKRFRQKLIDSSSQL